MANFQLWGVGVAPGACRLCWSLLSPTVGCSRGGESSRVRGGGRPFTCVHWGYLFIRYVQGETRLRDVGLGVAPEGGSLGLAEDVCQQREVRGQSVRHQASKLRLEGKCTQVKILLGLGAATGRLKYTVGKTKEGEGLWRGGASGR